MITKEGKITSKVNVITMGVVAWAAMVTIALIVVVAVVYRRLKGANYSSGSSSSAMSIISDAESGSTSGSVYDYDKSSIVDLEEHFDDGGDNSAMPELPVASSNQVPIDVDRLDSELNENTMEHVAAMHDEESPPETAEVHDKNHLTTSRHKFRHATFKGLNLRDSASSGNSFL